MGPQQRKLVSASGALSPCHANLRTQSSKSYCHEIQVKSLTNAFVHPKVPWISPLPTKISTTLVIPMSSANRPLQPDAGKQSLSPDIYRNAVEGSISPRSAAQKGPSCSCIYIPLLLLGLFSVPLEHPAALSLWPFRQNVEKSVGCT